MKSDDVIVSFRGVRKTYDGETLVVRNLDLDIYRGEFLTRIRRGRPKTVQTEAGPQGSRGP